MSPHRPRFLNAMPAALVLAGALALQPRPAPAQTSPEDAPRDVEEVSFQQKLNTDIPLDLPFRDATGQKVTLGEYFGEKPVLLALVYYECPMLCTLILNGMTEAMKELAFVPGRDYEVVTVSFDHEETHVLASNKKQTYLEMLDKDGAGEGWHFLVGEKEPIRTLADSVGFHYKYIPETGEYAHRSGIIVLTPDGTTSRYFPGVQYNPRDLRLGLVEASNNEIGSVVDKLFLLCYHYDPADGQYSMVITNVLNIACVITVLLIGGFLLIMWKWERRKKRLRAAESSA